MRAWWLLAACLGILTVRSLEGRQCQKHLSDRKRSASSAWRKREAKGWPGPRHDFLRVAEAANEPLNVWKAVAAWGDKRRKRQDDSDVLSSVMDEAALVAETLGRSQPRSGLLRI